MKLSKAAQLCAQPKYRSVSAPDNQVAVGKICRRRKSLIADIRDHKITAWLPVTVGETDITIYMADAFAGSQKERDLNPFRRLQSRDRTGP